MFSLRTLFLTSFLCLSVPLPAFAASQEAYVSTALTEAESKDWDAALSAAQQSKNALLVKLVTWQYLLDPESGASFHEITGFIRQNSGWPQLQRLKLRAEQALKNDLPPPWELESWFKDNPPVSGIGKLRHAEYLKDNGGDKETIQRLIREAWVDGDFDEREELRMIALYGSLFSSQLHYQRADRLLWEEKLIPAQRMLDYVGKGEKAVIRARVSLINNERNAAFYISHVTGAHAKDPGFLYARMRWRDKRDDDAGVREMLLAAPAHVPFAAKWWKTRESQIRKAIDARNYSLAARLLERHGQTEGSEYAEALWLKGWLMLQFQKKPDSAYTQFYDMFNAVKFPVSRARAAYWAARAAQSKGDKEAAKSWYTTASAYPTTFYGQLAAAEISGSAPLKLPAEPSTTAEERKAFRNLELARVVEMCVEADNTDLATQFIMHLIDSANSATDAALAARFGADIHSTLLGVRGAKRALQQNFVILDVGYPTTPLPGSNPIEEPLTWAITRQESEYDPQAESRSGALGLMQLLPGTAREVAKKADLPYSQGRLVEPEYNSLLGSLYLERLIEGYDGSYVQAIAAYNAGPGRVRGWVREFGEPGRTPESVVDWIEKIPFSETRNYVQRVLENLQVYRHITAEDKTPNLKIRDDLVR